MRLSIADNENLDVYEELKDAIGYIQAPGITNKRAILLCISCGEIQSGLLIDSSLVHIPHVVCVDCLMNQLVKFERLSPKEDN